MTATYHCIARAARRYSALELTQLFFAFSIFGWLWEAALHLVFDGELVNRGVLLGPWLPIYGVGGVLSVLLLRHFVHRPLLVFGMGTALCAAVEYIAGSFLLSAYGMRWWDYSAYPLNIRGFVCLQTSVIFGLGCCAALYFFAPALADRFARLPHLAVRRVGALLLILFACDLILSAGHPNSGAGVTDYHQTQSVQSGGVVEINPLYLAAQAQNLYK